MIHLRSSTVRATRAAALVAAVLVLLLGPACADTTLDEIEALGL